MTPSIRVNSSGKIFLVHYNYLFDNFLLESGLYSDLLTKEENLHQPISRFQGKKFGPLTVFDEIEQGEDLTPSNWIQISGKAAPAKYFHERAVSAVSKVKAEKFSFFSNFFFFWFIFFIVQALWKWYWSFRNQNRRKINGNKVLPSVLFYLELEKVSGSKAHSRKGHLCNSALGPKHYLWRGCRRASRRRKEKHQPTFPHFTHLEIARHLRQVSENRTFTPIQYRLGEQEENRRPSWQDRDRLCRKKIWRIGLGILLSPLADRLGYFIEHPSN